MMVARHASASEDSAKLAGRVMSASTSNVTASWWKLTTSYVDIVDVSGTGSPVG